MDMLSLSLEKKVDVICLLFVKVVTSQSMASTAMSNATKWMGVSINNEWMGCGLRADARKGRDKGQHNQEVGLDSGQGQTCTRLEGKVDKGIGIARYAGIERV